MLARGEGAVQSEWYSGVLVEPGVNGLVYEPCGESTLKLPGVAGFS